MKILIVAATDMEMAHIKDQLMKSCKMELAFCVTGIGSIATTYQLQKVITHSRPDLVIQLGIAGAFSDSITVGSAVAVKHEIVAEMGEYPLQFFVEVFKCDHSK